MAQMNAKAYDKAKRAPNTVVTVGNNREIMVNDDAVIGFLHGSPVFKWFYNTATLHVGACGYPTRTTCDAIKDFQRLVLGDVVAPVSYAGGQLSGFIADTPVGFNQMHLSISQ